VKDEYQKLIERIKDNDPELMEDLVPKSSNYVETARNARDLAENTLGSEYLKQTGVSVPNIKTATRSQLESFANKLKEEAYPELKNTNIDIQDYLKGGNVGEFAPSKNQVSLSKHYLPDAESIAGKTFHELGHAYDETKGLTGSVADDALSMGKKGLIKSLGLKSGSDLTKLDPSVISEVMQLGHHAKIPGLRSSSFGLSALKNLLSAKNFKSLPLAGPAIAGALTLAATGDASAATQAATPILSEAGDIGPEADSLEASIEDPTKSYEQRKKAIESLSKRNQ
jgi:hypothetical protein